MATQGPVQNAHPPAVVLGGGRWARVLISVLAPLLPEHTPIRWVTTHGYENAKAWAAQNLHLPLDVAEDIGPHKPALALVATAPHTHAHWAEHFMAQGVPVLVEKPFALTAASAQTLAAMAAGKAAGVNLEFMYAPYLQVLKERLAQALPRHITLTWHDPFHEQRHGEDKYADIYTSIIHDQLPHVWSILHTVWPHQPIKLERVDYKPEDGDVVLEGALGAASLSISLCRRAPARKRILSADEVTLDFTTEPGTLSDPANITPNPPMEEGPLKAALKSFLQVIENPRTTEGWPLHLGLCVEGVQLCDLAQQKLEKTLHSLIAQWQKSGKFEAHKVECCNMVVDLYAQAMVTKGQRSKLYTHVQQQAFVEDVMDRSTSQKRA